MPGTLIPCLAKAINGRASGTTWKVSCCPVNGSSTLTGLVNTEPGVGAQLPRAQKLQWFLSESNWEERKVQAERLSLLREDPSTAPTSDGVLVIDETGDRKDGHHTAH